MQCNNYAAWISAIAADMPSGAVIQSGKVKIAEINPNHLQIEQTTTKSVINWNSFSVHKGGRVTSTCLHQTLPH